MHVYIHCMTSTNPASGWLELHVSRDQLQILKFYRVKFTWSAVNGLCIQTSGYQIPAAAVQTTAWGTSCALLHHTALMDCILLLMVV